MRLGVAFPTTEIGENPTDIRDFAQAVEGLGFDYLTCIDHVVQAGTPNPGWQGYYVRDRMFPSRPEFRISATLRPGRQTMRLL